jgi:hypothetical protein
MEATEPRQPNPKQSNRMNKLNVGNGRNPTHSITGYVNVTQNHSRAPDRTYYIELIYAFRRSDSVKG